MKKFNLILFFIFSLTVSFGQIKFEIAYSTGGYDKAEGIVQTYDSGYAVIGSSEGFIGISDVYLMRVNKYGALLWSKTFGGIKIDQGQDIIETTDSGFAIIGYTNSFDTNSYQMYFIKTDKNGDTIFTKTIGEIDWDFGYALKQTSDGGYILAGETYKLGNSKGYIVKLDSIGNVSWRKTFGGINNDKFEDVIITSLGDFIFTGSSESFGNNKQAYVVKTNNLGVLTWQKTFGYPGTDFAKSIVELPSGELVFVGGTNTPPHADIDNWVVKLSSTGIQLQSIYVPDYSSSTPISQNDDWNESIIVHGNDTLIFGGIRTYDNVEPGNIYSYIHKSNLTSPRIGEFQKYISSFKEIVNDIKSTSDNGMIFACTAEGLGTGGSSIYLIKFDNILTNPPPYYNSISHQNDISSVEELTNTMDVNFFPNPVSNIGNFILKNIENKKITITIRDISGKITEIKTENNSTKIEMDFNTYSKGIYFATVSEENNIIKTLKIIVTN